MKKTGGAVYVAVVQELRKRGEKTDGVEIATLSRGPDHLVLRNGETVGEYNHVSKRLRLYKDFFCV